MCWVEIFQLRTNNITLHDPGNVIDLFVVLGKFVIIHHSYSVEIGFSGREILVIVFFYIWRQSSLRSV
jgi:hypothetical protein